MANSWQADAASQLAKSLPVLGSDHSVEGVTAYLDYYQIDFRARFPQVRHNIGTVKSGAFSLATHHWQLPEANKTLLIVHGYLDHVGLYGHIIEFGLSNGCNVIAFDLPGHGLSSGDRVTIDDFADYGAAIDSVLQTVAPQGELWVIGQSTGCSALIELARRATPWPFARTVMLAPLVRPAQWQLVRASHVMLNRFVHHVPRRFQANSSDAAFLERVKVDPLQSRYIDAAWTGALRRWLKRLPLQDLGVGPVLHIQGDADATVAWKYNVEAIGKLFPRTQTLYLAGAGHHLANEATSIRQHYMDHITDYVG